MADPAFRSTKTLMGKTIMGTNSWYITENNSGYTDFTYTDFSEISSNTPVRHRSAKKVAKHKAKKRSSAGKVFLSILGILAIGIVAYLIKDNVIESCATIISEGNFAAGIVNNAASKPEKLYEEAYKRTAEKASYSKSCPAYEIANSLVANLKRDNDIDTAWEIFNWVHSNVYYQHVSESMTFEEAAFRGLTRKSGDCYVSFACAKILLDCAGIPNLMVERYPIVKSAHYWNLVQLDGKWYHCDATVFKDHPGLYFMCTDADIADDHHNFKSALYPERAKDSDALPNQYDAQGGDVVVDGPYTAGPNADGPYTYGEVPGEGQDYPVTQGDGGVVSEE